MPKNNRRCAVTRTVTYTCTIDTPGRPEETDANMLTFLGGANGTTGPLSIAELLANGVGNNGTVTKSVWSITGTSTNIEPYVTRPQNTKLAVGQRIASVSPPAGYAAASGKLFVVTVAGTTDNTTTEPNWNLTNGGTTTDGTVTFRTIDKFPTIQTYAQSTVFPVGTVFKPSSTSMKEYLVTTANTAAASTPVWTSYDAMGDVVSFQTGGSAICIAGVVTFANLTSYQLGDVISSSASATDEYLCTVPGRTDVNTALSATVGNTVTIGSATFKRIV